MMVRILSIGLNSLMRPHRSRLLLLATLSRVMNLLNLIASVMLIVRPVETNRRRYVLKLHLRLLSHLLGMPTIVNSAQPLLKLYVVILREPILCGDIRSSDLRLIIPIILSHCCVLYPNGRGKKEI